MERDASRLPTRRSRSTSSSRSWRKLLPVLYPGVFPHLAALTADRADLVAILLTGIPSGIVPGFQNFTGNTLADMLRLNVAIPPAAKPNALGLLGGDIAGFPNGRRVFDDVVTIELRAIAGVDLPARQPAATRPTRPPRSISEGLTPAARPLPVDLPVPGLPHDGFDTPSSRRTRSQTPAA